MAKEQEQPRKTITMRTGQIVIIEGIHFAIMSIDPRSKILVMRMLGQKEVDAAYEADKRMRAALEATKNGHCSCKPDAKRPGVLVPDPECGMHFPKKRTAMRPDPCAKCGGEGFVTVGGEKAPCQDCNPEGRPVQAIPVTTPVEVPGQPCHNCQGSGKVKGMFGAKGCPECEGRGSI